MATRRPPIATIYIRDEVSIAIENIRKQFAKPAVNFASSLTQSATRNIGSVFGLLGISFIGGGFVAGIVNMREGLSKFAQKGLELNANLRRLNLSAAEYKQLVNIGIASGLSSDQAKADVEAFALAVLDLRRGTDSDTRKRLEDQSTAGSGTSVARQLQAKIDKDGDRPYNAMVDILKQMSRGSAGSNHDRLATQVWRDSFGLSSPAWNQAIDSAEEFAQDSFQPAEEDSIDFLLAQVENQREMENFQNTVGIAMLPAMTALVGWLAKFLEPANMESFIAQVKAWVKSMEGQNWDEHRKNIDKTLAGMKGGFSKIAQDLGRIVRSIQNISRIVSHWQHDDPTPAGAASPVRFTGGTVEGASHHVSAEYETWQLKNAEALPESSNIEDRRGGMYSPIQVSNEPIESGGQLASQLGIEDIGSKPANDNMAASQNLWQGGPLLFSSRSELTRFEETLNEMKREFTDLSDVLLIGVKTGRFNFGGAGATGSWSGDGTGQSGVSDSSGSRDRLTSTGLRRDTDNDPQAPAGDVEPGAVTAVSGAAPAAFIMHHTSGRGTAEGVVSTLRQRGLGVQYVMERDGTIKQIGGPGSSHMKTGWGPLGKGLSNRNTVGMEVIAKDDKDVTPAQIESAKKFIEKYYPNTPLYGHGQVNPGHKEEDEGMTIIDAIKKDRREKKDGRKQVDSAINGWQKDASAGSLDLEVNVKGGRGTKVVSKVTDGALMAEDRVKVSREMAA